MRHPLSDIKVVEVTNIYAGPMAGMLLAELGADVVKVESPAAPDPTRAGGGSAPDAVNGLFYALNRGKRFCAIDAKTDPGRQLLIELAATADVFLHNIRPGKAEALGLSYEELTARNTRLIYAAISGMGTDGPESHLPVFDYVLQAKIGMIDYQRDLATGKSDLVHQLVVDKVTANAVVQAILAALYMRSETGEGQRIDVPMVATGLSFFWPDGMAMVHHEVDPAIPVDKLPAHLQAAPGSMLGVFATSDGEVTLGILVPPWDGICLALDRADWVTDDRFAEPIARIQNLPELIDEIAVELSRLTTAEALERFARFDVASGPVVSRRDVHEDPTIKHLGLISEQDAAGVGRVRQPAPPWTFSRATTRITSTIGTTGADTVSVLTDLGVSADRIEQLLADGVVTVTDG